MEAEWDDDILTIEICEDSFPTRELIEKFLPEDRSSFPPFPDNLCGESENPYLARLFIIMWVNRRYRYDLSPARKNLIMDYSWDDLQYVEQDKLNAMGVYLRFTDWSLGEVIEAQWEASLISDHVHRQADDVALMSLITLHASGMMSYHDLRTFSSYMLGASEARVPIKADKLLVFAEVYESDGFNDVANSNAITAGFINSGLDSKQILEFMRSDEAAVLKNRKIDALGLITEANYDVPAIQEKLRSVPQSILEDIYSPSSA